MCAKDSAKAFIHSLFEVNCLGLDRYIVSIVSTVFLHYSRLLY
jgi:hypothetical protein